MEVFGTRERPRLLVIGLEEDSETGQDISKLVPTIRFLDVGDLDNVRQGDWDAVVLWEVDAELESHLFVLQFGGNWADAILHDRRVRLRVLQGDGSVSTEFAIPEEVPGVVARLVKSDLIPIVLERERVPTIGVDVIAFTKGGWGATPHPSEVVSPFLADADNLPVAGRYRREGKAEWWKVPAFVEHPARWVAAALELWRDADPERFPAEAAWQSNPQWQTDQELAVASELASLDREREEADRRFAEAAAELGLRQIEATQHADENERRLLTDQGDELVAEVIASLRELGFIVVDVDEKISTPGDRREDIRVSHPDRGDWIALGEVRGYARGAQLNDLLRLGRFVTRYVREEGREPDAVWYVVNQFIASDPAGRPDPLEANPNEVETFAEGRGGVIDTRDLFSLRMRVRRGEVTAQEARDLLAQATGRLDLK